MDDIFGVLKRWLDEGKNAAIATVVTRKGSALRPVGAKMIISSQGEMHGSVSGGCVESAVAEEAQRCLRSGKVKLLHYGISDDTAWSEGLMCGGEIDVFIQPVAPIAQHALNEPLITRVIELEGKRQPFAILTLVSGEKVGQICMIGKEGELLFREKPDWLDKEISSQLERLFDIDTSSLLTSPGGKIFADVHRPAPRLVIIGAVHVAMALIDMAHLMGYYTILIDPRKAFATGKRFPKVDQMLFDWPTEGLQKIHLNQDDFVLLLSHDDKLDLPAAGIALDAGARYIGMLASPATRERRFNLLVLEGYSKSSLEKIHAPIGLDIGARNPEEIAFSIMAEITAFRYGKAR